MKRLRNFCFTVNNYTQQDVDLLYNYNKFEYVIFGFEVGEQGTPHLQGYAELDKQYQFTLIKSELCQGMHIETRRGSQKQAIEYCKKEGNFVEKGTPKRSGQRKDLERVKEIIFEENGTMMDVINEVSSYQGLRGAQLLFSYKPAKKKYYPKTVRWFWGPSGCNKTRTAVEQCKEDYWISGETLKWFDGYYGQKYVVIDDFRKDFCTFHFLLRLLDVYFLRVPFKGGFVEWDPDVIFITSCYAPQSVYDTREDIYQLLRRISSVEYFARDGMNLEVDLGERVPTCMIEERGYCNCLKCIPEIKYDDDLYNVYPGH